MADRKNTGPALDFAGECTCEVPDWNQTLPRFGLVCHAKARPRHRRDRRQVTAARGRPWNHRQARWNLELPGLGQFDFDPKLDLGQHGIEAGITG